MNREVEILATFLYKTIDNIQVDVDIVPLDIYRIQEAVGKGYADGKPEWVMRFLSDILGRHNSMVSRMVDQMNMNINNIKSIEAVLEIYANKDIKKESKQGDKQ